MKTFDWDEEKNENLKKERGISFEQVIEKIEKREILDEIAHPNQQKYPGQKFYIIEFENYAYYIPFVENENKKFLKTIIPSRKFTKKHLKNDKN